MVIFRPEEPFSGQHNANNQHTNNDQLNFEKSCPPPKQWEGVKFQNTTQEVYLACRFLKVYGI